MKKSEMLTGNVTRFLLIVFFVVPGMSLFSLDVSETKWEADPRIIFGRIRLIFGADQHFMIAAQELMAEGAYSQTGNDITLNYTSILAIYRERIEKVGTKLSIVEIDDLFYRYKLVGDGEMEFFSSDYRPQQREKRKIDGITVYVYDAAGTVNGDARVREVPGLQYNSVSSSSQEEVLAPKGTGITIFGRSEHQTMIDGVTAYWYYCEWSYDWKHWKPADGWIWGGLIDLKK